jgi:hypothetical protein
MTAEEKRDKRKRDRKQIAHPGTSTLEENVCMTKKTLHLSLALGFVLMFVVAFKANAEAITIDFETLPVLPPQPNNFFDAGPMQTYSQAGIFTISGGVVLGSPPFLPAFTNNGSLPNLYGTSNVGDPSLLSTITLAFATSAFRVTSVSFLLFNGRPISQSYMLFGMVGGANLDPLPIGPLEPASSSGFTTLTLSSSIGPFTRLNIAPMNANNGWDFFIDKIVLTGTPVSQVPDPSSLVLLIGPLGAVAWLCHRRSRRSGIDLRD